jgi:segregation and condensation protein A
VESAQVPSFLKRNSNVLIDCRIQVPDFEGPLDLLLHLIKNHELDLVNLPIAKITRQYLDYLDYMREMNLDLASDYLVMAATLTYLKSAAILPEDESSEATGLDPRAQLIRRLIELKSYKELARALAERPRLFRDVFPCRNTGAEEMADGIEAEVAITNPFQLAKSYSDLIDRRKTVTHNIYMEEVPVAKSVERLVNKFEFAERLSFSQLLPDTYKAPDFISTFLAVLELTKMQFTGIEQENTFGPINVHRRVPAEHVARANQLIKGLSWE